MGRLSWTPGWALLQPGPLWIAKGLLPLCIWETPELKVVSSFSKLPDALELNDVPLGTCLWGSEARKVTPMVTSMCACLVDQLCPTGLLSLGDSSGKNTGNALAMLSSRRSSQPKDQICISCVSCIAGRFFTHWVIGEALNHLPSYLQKRILHTLDQWGPKGSCMSFLVLVEVTVPGVKGGGIPVASLVSHVTCESQAWLHLCKALLSADTW